LLVETCVKTIELREYAKKLGYDEVLSEDKYDSRYRLSLELSSKEEIAKYIRKIKDNKVILFVKPLSFEAFKYSLQSPKVAALILDRKNIGLIGRKGSLNLIRQAKKPVEVQLKNLEVDVIYKVIQWNKWIEYPILSSCASKFNEIWSPLSKFSLLVTLGANESDALKWIYNNPTLLIGNYDRTTTY